MSNLTCLPDAYREVTENPTLQAFVRVGPPFNARCAFARTCLRSSQKEDSASSIHTKNKAVAPTTKAIFVERADLPIEQSIKAAKDVLKPHCTQGTASRPCCR
jgi:hypothetical protein